MPISTLIQRRQHVSLASLHIIRAVLYIKAPDGNIQNCVKCLALGKQNGRLEVPKVPKSRRSQSKIGSKKTSASENEREIRAIEEKMEMERRQNAAKLKLLDESHIREKQLMDRKISLIRESSSVGGSVKSVSSGESSKRRVSQWKADFENADKVYDQQETGTGPKDIPRPQQVPMSSTQIQATDLTSGRCVIARAPIKDLPKLTGDPLEWPVFIASFESSTKVYNIQNSENLIRLQSCLRGDALEAVKGTLIFPEKVPDAIKRLKLLFGRPEYIINKIQPRIMDFSNPKIDKFNTIIEYATYVESMVLTMQQAKMSAHLQNPSLLLTMVQKLPTQMQLMVN